MRLCSIEARRTHVESVATPVHLSFSNSLLLVFVWDLNPLPINGADVQLPYPSKPAPAFLWAQEAQGNCAGTLLAASGLNLVGAWSCGEIPSEKKHLLTKPPKLVNFVKGSQPWPQLRAHKYSPEMKEAQVPHPAPEGKVGK